MIYEFEPLTQDEKEMMLKAPALIAVLIAGADNTIEQQELNHAVKLVNIKAFSEKLDLQPYYHEVENTIQQDIEEAIAALPQSSAERNAIINDELAKLNTVLPRLKHKFAHDIYNSWKTFAHSIARSWGGVLGINAVSEHEKQWIDLPMINEPMAA